jgi:hypothetical protein
MVPFRGQLEALDVALISGFVRQNMPLHPSPDASSFSERKPVSAAPDISDRRRRSRLIQD